MVIVDKKVIRIVLPISPFCYRCSPALVFPGIGKRISVASMISVAKMNLSIRASARTIRLVQLV